MTFNLESYEFHNILYNYKQQSCCKIFTYEIVKHHNHSHHGKFQQRERVRERGGVVREEKSKFVNVLRESMYRELKK